MHGKMLGTCQQLTIFAYTQVLAVVAYTLQATHHSQSHLSRQVRVLAIGFLSAAPTGITEYIDVRCPER